MAELGVIASVVGIAGVGIKLSKTLFQVGHTVVSADHNIHQIARNVTLFSQSLKQVGAVLRSSHSLHTPEAIETVEEIVRQCEATFQEITAIVVSANNADNVPNARPIGANGRRRRLSVLQRAKWYFEQPKVDWLLAQLECLKTTLSMFIQTLGLAALMSSLKQAEDNKEELSERIESERMHVETLIMAQQLSVVILNTKQHDASEGVTTEQGQRSASPSGSEATIEVTRQQLLTNESSTPSLAMVRLGNGDLDFLNTVARSDRDTSAKTIFETTAPLVDELLRRWTRLDEPLPLPAGRPRVYRQESEAQQPEPEHIMTPNSSEAGSPGDENRQLSAPDLKLHPVESLEKPPPRYTASPESTMTPKYLDPKIPPPPRGPAPRKAEKLEKQDRSSSPSPPSYSPRSGSVDFTADSLALTRTATNPEKDHTLLRLETFQDHHGLIPYQPTPNHNFNSTGSSPTSPSTMSYYTSSRRGPLRLTAPPPVRPSNYRSPFVEAHLDESDYTSSSGSDHSHPKHSRRHRRTSNGSRRRHSGASAHSHHDSGISNGLNIPWRLRTNPLEYYDFIDARLMGPRTPIAPPDPRPWIYSQPGATTELSKEWVDEAAIRKQGLKYVDVRLHETDGFLRGMSGEEAGWKIMQPLEFTQVDALVNRTIAIFRQRSAATSAGANPVSTSRAAPQQPPQLSRQPQPYGTTYPPPPNPPVYANAKPAQPPQHPHAHPQARRGVSFQSGLPAPTSNTRDRSPGLQSPYTFASTSASGPGPWGPGAPPGRHPNWADAYKDSDGHEEARWARDRERAYERQERERERDRSFDGRPVSRGKDGEREHRHGHRRRDRDRDREREREREEEKKREKKKSGSSVASTMVKIGSLAALLEGLDGAF